MNKYKKILLELRGQIDRAFLQLDISSKEKEIASLEMEVARPEIWNNPTEAQQKNKILAGLRKTIDPLIILKTQIEDVNELVDLADSSMEPELDSQIDAFKMQLHDLEKQLYLDKPYDNHNAVIRISAGVGGTDAQDWAEILERMYLRWAEKEDMQADILERSAGEEAGLKTSVLEISGPYAYGKLRSENGVHRLVRLSPFNSDNLRQTSFALVEVLPEIETPEEAVIEDKDLKVDVYRAGGHGGQSVNTTDSAVRITHIPTGIVVAIQNERSQLQNKETAMKILRSKLIQMQLEQHADSIGELRAGESANWGSQIRNYVMHPYTLVKDTRTKFETNDIQSVLDGNISGFIEAYLVGKVDK